MNLMRRYASSVMLGVVALSCVGDDFETTGSAADPRSHKTAQGDALDVRERLIRSTQAGAPEIHSVREVVRDGERVFVARAQDFDAYFGANAVALGEAATAPTVALREIGCGQVPQPIHAGAPTARRNQVSYVGRFADGWLSEWYVSGPLGLEQGFTVASPPGCSAETGELLLDVALDGATSELAETGDAVHFRGGGRSFRYGDLYARDAKGAKLPSKIQLSPNGVLLRVDIAGAVFPIEIDPLISQEQARLVASDAAAGATFGWSVAISGDTAVVGAVAGSSDPGAAYVYVRTGGTWLEQQKLTPTDPSTGKMFGAAVAAAGDTILVGAPGEDSGAPGIGTDRGSAYIFVRAGGVWTQQQKLSALDAPDFPSSLGDGFGSSVALQSDTAVIGAPGDDNGASFPSASDRGGAYVFVRTGSSWAQQQKLVAADAAQADHFGTSVALSAESVAIGSPDEDDDDPFTADVDHGSAYVFLRAGSTWSQQQKVSPNTSPNARTGRAVAIDADTLIVAGNADSRAFVRSGSLWTPEQTFSETGSVAIFGNVAAIGNGLSDHSGLIDAGVVSTFARSGTSWSPAATVVADDAAELDHFGAAIALAGDTLLVGAAGVDDVGSSSGAAYAFVLVDVGGPCAAAGDCASGFCVDGVCCAEACGGGVNDCEVCASSLGATADGVCTPLTGPGCDTASGSEEFIITCEIVPPQKPGLAVNGSLGLASWVASDDSIHAARFGEDGAVLDAAAIVLGEGPPQGPLLVPTTALGSLVVATASGYAVVGLFEANDGLSQYLTAQYREVGTDGTVIPGGWQPIHTAVTSITIDAQMWLEDSGFDGTTSYVVIRRQDEQGMAFPVSYRVFQLGATSPVLTVLSSPTWGGFGCRTGSCLATWFDSQTAAPTAQIIGQAAGTLPAFYDGTIVGTPTGFLGAGSQLVAYSSSGSVSAGPIPLPTPVVDAVFDGVATRAAWLAGGDLSSLTAADNAAIVSGPSLVVTSSPSEFQLGSFGNERTVAVFQPGAGVTGRFLGSLPATVPTGCPTASGGGGSGGGGSGGEGGSGVGGSNTAGNDGTGGIASAGGGGGVESGGSSPAGGAPGSGGGAGRGGSSAGAGGGLGGSPASAGGHDGNASPSGGNSEGGSRADGDGATDGCDCTSTGTPSSGWAGWLLALAILRRRRPS